jgi:hypothetical protein
MKKMTKYLMVPHLITKIDYITVITMPEIMKQYSNNRQSEHPYELYAVEMERTIKSDEDILKHMSRWT